MNDGTPQPAPLEAEFAGDKNRRPFLSLQTTRVILLLVGGSLVLVGLSLHLVGFAPLLDVAAENATAAIGTSRTTLVQTEAALNQSAEAVKQLRLAYHQFTTDVVPAAVGSMGTPAATLESLGTSLIRIGTSLDKVAIPTGVHWKSWTETPELVYARPLIAASTEFQAQGASIQKAGVTIAAAREILSKLGPTNDQVTPALIQAEGLLRSLASEHLPRIDEDLSGIQFSTTRLSSSWHLLAMAIWLTGLGFAVLAFLPWQGGGATNHDERSRGQVAQSPACLSV